MLSIDFDIEPLSQNNIERNSAQANRRYKTSKAVNYKNYIHTIMSLNRSKINNFLAEFNPEIHGITLCYQWRIKHDLCLTKRKNKSDTRRISSRGGDTGNYEKWATDCIFGFLGINDFFIIKIIQEKYPSLERSSFHASLILEQLDHNEHYKKYLTM